MNVLIVDNGTSYISELERLVKDYSAEVIDYNSLNYSNVDKYDLIILSGGHEYPVVGNGDKFANEIKLIKNFSKPILGVCLGFELTAYSFGARLKLLEKREKGFLNIELINDNLLTKSENIKVYESHRWVVDELPKELIGLGKSKDGYELFKHKNKPIYGFQFHPEMFVDKTQGDDIFNNVLERLAN